MIVEQQLLEYLRENVLVVVPALWVLGMFAKQTPRVPNWLIPWGLLVVSLGLTHALHGVGADAWIQGILAAGAAVLGHQLLKQSVERD